MTVAALLSQSMAVAFTRTGQVPAGYIPSERPLLRAFLFHSSFFEKFKIGEKARLKLAQDDEALLRFAFDWLGFVLLGEKTITRA